MESNFDFKELAKTLERILSSKLLKSLWMLVLLIFQILSQLIQMIWIFLFPRIQSFHLGKKCLIMRARYGFKINFNF